MKKGKIFGMALVFVMIMVVFPSGALPLENQALAQAAKTLYVDDDLVDYPAADFTKIQDAVDAASPGDTIIVYPGTYTENVNVNKDHLTIRSENGAEVTIVQAASPHDSVFDITAAYVTLNGFTATGAVAAIEKEEHVAGIFLDQGTEHCSVYNNVVCNNSGNGICVRGLNHTLRNNSMSGNIFNLSFDGNEPSDFIHDIDASNLVDGKPVYCWVNQHDKQIPSDAGFVGLINCTSIAVQDLTLTHNVAGVWLVSSTNSRIENVTTSDNFVGIILLYSSNNNIISDNTCNDIAGSIYLDDSSNNTIYINNFINNVEKGRSIDSTNTWHSPEEITYTYNGNTYTTYLGNYWSDYVGGDAGGDGIGDTPYPMDSDPDNYPLMEPFENYQLGFPVAWNLQWGLDADPAAVNIWTYPEDAGAVTLADVEWSMPPGLLIWYYGGPSEGWRFYKKGWGAVNTLETLIPGKGYISIVPTASVWQIPQG